MARDFLAFRALFSHATFFSANVHGARLGSDKSEKSNVTDVPYENSEERNAGCVYSYSSSLFTLVSVSLSSCVFSMRPSFYEFFLLGRKIADSPNLGTGID
jgi:hypothetical protein